jgi:hypothetical protein
VSVVVVREVRIVSIVRIVFWLSLALWAVLGVGLLALYIVGAAAGGLGGFRGFMTSLGLSGLWLNPLTFVPIFSIFAGIGSVVAAAAGALVGLLYNALSPLVGGVEIVSRER